MYANPHIAADLAKSYQTDALRRAERSRLIRDARNARVRPSIPAPALGTWLRRLLPAWVGRRDLKPGLA